MQCGINLNFKTYAVFMLKCSIFFFYVSINKNLCKVDNFNCLYLNSLKVKSKNSSNVLKYFKIFVDIQNSVLSLVEQIKCHKTNGS